MKSHSTSPPMVTASSRRTFLRSAGLLALAAPVTTQAFSPGAESSCWWRSRNRLSLFAEGDFYLNQNGEVAYVIPPPDMNLMGAHFGFLYHGPPPYFTIAVRLRVEYPVLQDHATYLKVTLYFYDYLNPPPMPYMGPVYDPQSPPPENVGFGAPLAISRFLVDVQDVATGSGPVPQVPRVRIPALAFFGQVVSNQPVVSPYGNLESLPCCVSLGYGTRELATHLSPVYLLSVACAGNHTSIGGTSYLQDAPVMAWGHIIVR